MKHARGGRRQDPMRPGFDWAQGVMWLCTIRAFCFRSVPLCRSHRPALGYWVECPDLEAIGDV